MEKNRIETAFLLLVGFLVMFFSSAIKGIFQVFFVAMGESFQKSRGDFAIAGAIFMLVMGIASPLAGYLCDKYGSKKVILSGLVLAGGAFISISYINSFVLFIILYGIVSSIALAGMAYVPMGILVDRAVSRDKKGLAYSIITNGVGLGFIFLSPLWVFLNLNYNWELVYRWTGYFFLIPLSLGIFFFLKEKKLDKSFIKKESKVNQIDVLKQIWKDRNFYTLAISFLGCGVAMTFIDIHLVPFMQDLKISPAVIGGSLSTLGITEVIGGVLAGYLISRKLPGNILLSGYYLLRVVSLIVLIIVPNPIGIFVFTVLFGLSYMATVVLTSTYCLQIYGKRIKGIIFGFLFLGHQIGAFISAKAGAEIYDFTGSYQYTIMGIILICIIASIAATFIRIKATAPEIVETQEKNEVAEGYAE